MKLDVPFRRQKSDLECGPVNLQMATAFLGDEKGLEEIKELIDFSDKAVFTIQLATAAEKLGFEAEFYTRDLWNEHNEKDYYEEYAEDISNKTLNSEAREAGVTIEERELELKELLGLLRDDQILLVLLDWHRIFEKEGYFGHFAVVVGYDEENALVHNSDAEDGAYTKINREKFDAARKANGTDQDVAVISH
jgi:ABC-type bacteriocin/lantibiotic exporter with double-glycine peptidase domain